MTMPNLLPSIAQHDALTQARRSDEAGALVQAMDNAGTRLKNRTYKEAGNEVLSMLSQKGPENVSTKDVLEIGTKYRLAPEQMVEVFGMIEKSGALDLLRTPVSSVLEGRNVRPGATAGQVGAVRGAMGDRAFESAITPLKPVDPVIIPQGGKAIVGGNVIEGNPATPKRTLGKAVPDGKGNLVRHVYDETGDIIKTHVVGKAKGDKAETSKMSKADEAALTNIRETRMSYQELLSLGRENPVTKQRDPLAPEEAKRVQDYIDFLDMQEEGVLERTSGGAKKTGAGQPVKIFDSDFLSQLPVEQRAVFQEAMSKVTPEFAALILQKKQEGAKIFVNSETSGIEIQEAGSGGGHAGQDEAGPGLNKPMAEKPRQAGGQLSDYSSFTVDKKGTIWGDLNGQPTRIMTKPKETEMYYGKTRPSTEYAKYTDILRRIGELGLQRR